MPFLILPTPPWNRVVYVVKYAWVWCYVAWHRPTMTADNDLRTCTNCNPPDCQSSENNLSISYGGCELSSRACVTLYHYGGVCCIGHKRNLYVLFLFSWPSPSSLPINIHSSVETLTTKSITITKVIVRNKRSINYWVTLAITRLV